MPKPTLSRSENQLITRKRLRDSALNVFALKGIHGAGIEQIAKDAGYSRGAFYANYDSKLDILIEILSEKQVTEIKLWREFIESVDNPETGLAKLTEQYDNREQNIQRNRINVELQLEADRNPEFKPVFESYLDSLYLEIRRFYLALLQRYGKAAPDNLDSLVVTTRLLGLGLGSQTALGNTVAAKLSPAKVMLDYMQTVIAAAPALTDALHTKPKR